MRGLVLAGTFGIGLLWAAGCAVGITGDPVDDDAGPAPTLDGSASATTTRPDGSTNPIADATPETQPPADVIVPPVDSGADSGGCSGGLVINEVQTEGTSNANDEFVELYNPNTCDVPLDGWSLKYASGSGTGAPAVFFTASASHRVMAKQYFVIGGPNFSGFKSATYTPGQLAAGDGQVGLFNKLDAQVDAVGYGTIGTKRLVEVNPAPTPGNPPRSIQRTPNGADTNNNQVDFRSAAPTPNGPTL